MFPFRGIQRAVARREGRQFIGRGGELIELEQADSALERCAVGEWVGGELVLDRRVFGGGQVEQRACLQGRRGAKSLCRLRIARLRGAANSSTAERAMVQP